ncbi:rod shape-determining protein [Candidatus Nomurabacteria bacterium RIFCSPHIGHO2_01_FULL_39_9]|uniref:Cell shape-determining protein MreB n=1 Tax=Candidatus Nomurabacteria bacterium RIFCSPHIGHO2_01_FULL_39_9 TaxID=1801735 RepID=A0A1F6UVN4_9BACT|nr:MAG: rod shape-determining protein [Candidatus Nomurabacteria bacterium RIFCSPHIGHO2_01_FULL_39_9]
MLNKFYNVFSNNIGIDLGTVNTLVYLNGKGIVINEPSVVAVNQKTGQIVAVGADAKQMIGRTPGHIKAVRPIVDGVISDFEVTEEMLSYLINKTEELNKKMFRPKVIVGTPVGITSVETRAVHDAARSAGAREVYIIEEPMAAAIGIGLPVLEPVGSMIIDIGGGTSDIAVISLGGIVKAKSLKIAGDRFNNDIISYLKDEFKLLIGDRSADAVKTAIGTATSGPSMEAEIRGRDLITGLPKAVIITDSDIREAIRPALNSLAEGAAQVLESTPPELLSDIVSRGITLVGGGALLKGLDKLLAQALKVPIKVAVDPLTAVARGTGVVLEDFDNFKHTLFTVAEDEPLQ